MAYESEAAHWYDREGKGCHTVPNKSKPGESRNTTIRDAKKMGLVPSVSGILGQLDKPALTRWHWKQRLQIAHRMPHIENYEEWERMVSTEFAESNTAAAIGTRIHGAIEEFYETGVIKSGQDHERVCNTILLIDNLFPNREWSTERAFSSSLGYGGCCDLHCPATGIERAIVLDFKTKDGDVSKGVKMYDDINACQLESYGKGLGLDNPILVNVFISRTDDSVSYKVWDKSDTYWKKFNLLLDLWKLNKGYDSGY